MKMSLSAKVQIALGFILVGLMVATAFQLQVVPTDPANKQLFDRILDAIFIVLNVPQIAELLKKEQHNEKNDPVGAIPSTPDDQLPRG